MAKGRMVCMDVISAHNHLNIIAARWKLHFRPAHLSITGSSNIPTLPINISVDRILADFLRYVKQQVEAYIKTSHGNGSQLWSVLFPGMIVILTAPNGWEGSQQHRMRQAVVVSGLVNAQGEDRVRFVSEAEVYTVFERPAKLLMDEQAAILFAIDSGCIGDWIKVSAFPSIVSIWPHGLISVIVILFSVTVEVTWSLLITVVFLSLIVFKVVLLTSRL